MSATQTITRTPLRDLLVFMAGDAAMYRRPEPSTHCPACSAGVADRCDECADDEALAGEYDTLRANLTAVTTDTAALIALAELVEQSGPEVGALLTGTEAA